MKRELSCVTEVQRILLHICIATYYIFPLLSVRKCLSVFTQYIARWSTVVVVVSINPINNYQEPNLSINKSHNFMIWQWNEEKSVSNCYHACLILALFLSLLYTHSLKRQDNKKEAPWFHLLFISTFSPVWEVPCSSFTHLSYILPPLPHSLSLFLIWSVILAAGILFFILANFFFHFSITDSPVLFQCHLFHNCFCQQNIFHSLSAFHIRFMP